MRLIDADALKDWSEIVPLTWDGGIDINDFEEKLKSMPTVDAEPVRHGRWIKDPHLQVDFPSHFYMMWKCSDCGHSVDNPTPHCPWCGAKMDAERKKKNEIN